MRIYVDFDDCLCETATQVRKQNRLNPSSGKGLSRLVCMAYLSRLESVEMLIWYSEISNS